VNPEKIRYPDVMVATVRKDSPVPYITHGINAKKRQEKEVRAMFTKKQWREMQRAARRKAFKKSRGLEPIA
jgi:hypothetical protein